MKNSLFIAPIIAVLVVVVPYLLGVAYVTVAERKTMASMQRRVGPNAVGFFGSLQAFADALKLLLKEYVAPSQSNIYLFFFGPVLTLTFSLLVIAVIPFAAGIAIYCAALSILYLLALSSISTYGILLAGWSANSKYAFLGSLRSTAQLISYELILTSAILIIIFFTGSLNLNINVEAQKAIWFLVPAFPAFIIFLISSVAETNRAPFDLAEAESELVSGFMTEHSSVVFVFFFLAEYGSIVFMCLLISLLFVGGYLYNIDIDYIVYIYNEIEDMIESVPYMFILYDDITGVTVLDVVTLSIKGGIFVFVFIWVRASFPRIRYDQLMLFCWLILLPVVIAYIIYTPCVSYINEILPFSAAILGFFPIKKKLNKNTIKDTDITKLGNSLKVYGSIAWGLLMPIIIAMLIKLGLSVSSIWFDLMSEGIFDLSSILATLDGTLLAENTGTETGTAETGDSSSKPTDTSGKTEGTESKPEKPQDNKPSGSGSGSGSEEKPSKPKEKPTFLGGFEGRGQYYPPAGSGWGWGM